MAEEKYRSIFDHVQEGIFQTTADGEFISANPMLARIYGFDSPEELISQMKDVSRELYVDPHRREEFIKIMTERDVIHNFVSQIKKNDGSLIWIAENVRAVRNKDGQLLYYEGTVVDITEKEETEKPCVIPSCSTIHWSKPFRKTLLGKTAKASLFSPTNNFAKPSANR